MTTLYHQKNKGFTLLEILVAIGIVLLITSIGVVSYSQVTRKSRDAKRTSDIEQIRQALEMYRSDNGYYPASTATLVTGSYISALPTDPKTGTAYTYTGLNTVSGRYYGYCVCGTMEITPANAGTCASLPGACNFGQKNP